MIDLNPKKSNETHVVIGAGQIGKEVARVLGEAGYTVRLARRGAPTATFDNVTWFQGDIKDTAFANRLCADAAVIYNCANPTDYHSWQTTLAPLFESIYAAAKNANAKYVVLDNLYMYGIVDGPMREYTPMIPNSKKGALRMEVAQPLIAAQKSGEMQIAIGRASDFFGPHTPNSMFGDRVFDALAKNKPVDFFGDIDLDRSYAYTLDVALGLAILGTQENAMGQIWHLPVSSQGTTRTFVEAMSTAFGATPKFRRLPRWAVKLLGFFVATIGAMVEMMYQWENAFVVDDSHFTKGSLANELIDLTADPSRMAALLNSSFVSTLVVRTGLIRALPSKRLNAEIDQFIY